MIPRPRVLSWECMSTTSYLPLLVLPSDGEVTVVTAGVGDGATMVTVDGATLVPVEPQTSYE